MFKHYVKANNTQTFSFCLTM